jgi:hypothetical protein
MTVDFSALTDLINATMTILATINTNFGTILTLVINFAIIGLVGIVVYGFVGAILKGVAGMLHKGLK